MNMQTARPAPLQLLDLDDDVLLLILRKLNIFKQYEMTTLHSRFRNIVQTLWHTRLREVILYPELFIYKNEKFPEQKFIDFILAVSTHMTHLMCHNLGVQKLRLLNNKISLQLVHTFEWIDNGSEDAKENCIGPVFMDEDVLMLHSILPNLHNLKLRSCQVTGKYISNFKHLHKLSLDGCQYLESEHFRDLIVKLHLKKFDIMENCDEINCCDLADLKKCPTLEHIKIADYHLCFEVNIVNDILSLPLLRKLSIYSKNFVFDVLERIPRNHIKTIIAFKFTGALYDFGRFFREIAHMRHLKKLQIYECYTHDDNIEGIRDHMLVDVAKQLYDLEEVHFCYCDMESYRGILNFIKYCPSLKLINLNNSRNLGDQFIWHCHAILAKQLWRTEALELLIKHSDIDQCIEQNPLYLPNDRLLRINTSHVSHRSKVSGVLKFTFAHS